MLNDHDIDWLAGELAATAEAMGQVLSDNTAALMIADFQSFTKEQLKEALHRVRMESTGKLTHKAVLDQLDTINGRLGADEAFALVLKAKDETQTVVWTDEIALAWTACAPVLQSKDQVGARMAFKQAYERIAQDARAHMRRPTPVISAGSDPELRRVAITQAHKQGRLPFDMAKHALKGLSEFDPDQNTFVALGASSATQLALPPPTAGVGAVLVQMPVAGLVAPQVAKHFRDVREAAAKKAAKVRRRKLAMERLDRMRLKQRKRQLDQAVQEHLSQKQTTASIKE